MTRRSSERTEDYDRDVEVEALTLQLADLIETTLQKCGVTRAELARRMGVSRGHITQTLSGQRNMTLRTVAEALYELGHRLEASAVPLHEPTESTTSTERTPLVHLLELSRQPRSSRACFSPEGTSRAGFQWTTVNAANVDNWFRSGHEHAWTHSGPGLSYGIAEAGDESDRRRYTHAD